MEGTQRLNIFQRLVRHWETFHPYNAAQVLHVRGAADVPGLCWRWRAAVDSLGIGKVRLDPRGDGFSYEALNGELPEHLVRLLPEGVSLQEHLSDQLNRPFDPACDYPFRPFILPQQDSHYFGIVYQHWTADSVSIRRLMRDWYAGRQVGASTPPTRLDGTGYWRALGPQRANWRPLETALSSVRWSSRVRRARRVDAQGFGDFRARFALHPTPVGLVEGLLAYARARGVTLNELFLAAIAEACDRHVPAVLMPWRNDLALGNIVDLRPHGRHALRDVFGLYLGFTSVVCRPADLKDWDRLLRVVSNQCRLHKQSHAAAGSMLRMAWGLLMARWLKTPDLIEFYRKRTPLAGGISNVNIREPWAAGAGVGAGAGAGDRVLDYIRVSPTGPMLPVAFTTTTLGQRLNLGLTWRPSLIGDSQADDLARCFLARLQSVASLRPCSKKPPGPNPGGGG